MKRTVVLISGTWQRNKDPRIPLGHASILTKLEQQSHLTIHSVIVPVNQPFSHTYQHIWNLVAELPKCSVDVAIGVYVWSEEWAQSLMIFLRKQGFSGRLILGGPQISYVQHGLEDIYPHADVFIRGYGEEALASVVNSPFRKRIVGVHWAGQQDLCNQAHIDLTDLPSPWLKNGIFANQTFIRWETQRGCPFQCSFCQHQEAGARLPQRELSFDRLQQEIVLFSQSGIKEIAVLDPVFNQSPYATSILETFQKHNFKGKLSLQCRAETLSDAFLEAASKLDVVLELGLQTIHKEEELAIQRRNNIPRFEQVLSKIQDLGMAHEVSVIFGLPMQTQKSFIETISWCLKNSVPTIKAFPLLLLRGTAMSTHRTQWSLKTTNAPMNMVVSSSTFTNEEWQFMAQISEVLCQTESQHPNLYTLLKTASSIDYTLCRWIPKQYHRSAS